MIEADATYVVMGLLDTDSIAYTIGRTIESHGGRVVYTGAGLWQIQRIRRPPPDARTDARLAARVRDPTRIAPKGTAGLSEQT